MKGTFESFWSTSKFKFFEQEYYLGPVGLNANTQLKFAGFFLPA